MKHSVFWRLVLFALPVLLLMDFAVLLVAYHITYNNNLTHFSDDVRQASELAAKFFEIYDPNSDGDMEACSIQFDELCDILDISYIFAVKPDLESDSFTYYSVGFGKDAIETAKKTLHAGYTVHGINPEMKSVCTGQAASAVRFEDRAIDDTLLGYAPVAQHFDDARWKYVTDDVFLVSAEIRMDDMVNAFQARFNMIVLLVLLSTVPTLIFLGFLFRRMVSKPARTISRRMSDFVLDRANGYVPLEVRGKDEFAEMAHSFNSMAQEIDTYIEDISALNKQMSTHEAEMNIAHTIQAGLLEPSDFRGNTAEIHACMHPARDVGGDLYDYQVLGDGSICVIIADVSGKGITAALFMSRAITMLHQYAEAGLSPAEILFRYNNHLAAHNPNTMFITTFVGIYRPDTGELTYANAGHNFPYLLSDSLVKLDGAHGMAAGIFSDVDYTECTVPLRAGDVLFLYTDGVTEAKNTREALFEEEALERVLQEHLADGGEAVLNAVLDSVHAFSKDAPQNDDITILTLSVPKTLHKHLHLAAKTENLVAVKSAIEALDVSEEPLFRLRLISEEIFVNICSYAYTDGGDVDITIEADEKTVTLTFADSGKPFDPTADVIAIEDYDAENSIGGLGRYITFEIADAYSYEYKDGKNILRIEINTTGGKTP